MATNPRWVSNHADRRYGQTAHVVAALDHSLRQDGVDTPLPVRPGLGELAHPPRSRGIPRQERKSWTAEELQTFLQAAASHRLFPVFWLIAYSGMRRNEVLGLQWGDLDVKKGTVAISRGIVDVGYQIRQTRGKTPRSRRPVDLDQTTLELLAWWRA